MPPKEPKEPTEEKKQIASRLKQLLDRLQLTPKELAAKLGYKRPDNIYNALGGELFPGVQLLIDLLNNFENIDIVWLLTGKLEGGTSPKDVVTLTIDEKKNTQEIAELRATTQVIAGYVLRLMKDYYNDPNKDFLAEYGEDLKKQLQKLRK